MLVFAVVPGDRIHPKAATIARTTTAINRTAETLFIAFDEIFSILLFFLSSLGGVLPYLRSKHLCLFPAKRSLNHPFLW